MMLVNCRWVALLGGAITVAAAQMPIAFAQDAPADPAQRGTRATALQRLVVGAGEEKIAIDTPQAVSVVDQEELDQQQPTTVGDVFDTIPGVTVSGSERVLGETFNIRGIGAPESAGDEGRIIVTLDGASKFYESYRMGSFFSDPEFFKRVEVLRGPASSTLYGSGALGGVIVFTTKDAADYLDPGETAAIRVKSSYDSNPDGFLGSGLFAFRPNEHAEFLIGGNYRAADEYENGNGDTVPGSDFTAPSGLLKGTFHFGDANEQTIRASYVHWSSDDDNQPYAQVSTTPAFGNVDRKVTDKTATLSYENPASDNPWIDLKVTASYSDTTNEQENATGAGSVLFNDIVYGYETVQLSAENTIETSGASFENYLTFGVQASRRERTTDTVTPLGFHPEGTRVLTGFFVQDEYVWNERLTLIPGMRTDFQQLTPGDRITGASKSDDTAFSPKIAAHYKITDSYAVFGSLAHTERLPTIDEIFSSDFAPPLPANYSLDLQKERSNNIEGGVAFSDYGLFQPNDAFQIKTTVFYNDVRDYIERIRFAYPQYTNIGHVTLYGIEVEAAYDSEFLFAKAGYSLIRGKNEVTGGYLNTVPPDELTLTLGGRLPEHDLSFGWNGRFVAEQDRVVGTTTSRPRTGGFATHGIFLNWKPDDGDLAGLEARVSVENLFDKQYKEYLSNDDAAGRTFKLSLAREFSW